MADREKLEEKSCKGKQFFSTRKLAKGIAKKMVLKYKEKLTAYKCSFCPGYHVGHIGTTRRSARKEPYENLLERS